MDLLSVSLIGCVLHFASETFALACSLLLLVNMQSGSIFPFQKTLPLGLPLADRVILFPLIWTHSTTDTITHCIWDVRARYGWRISDFLLRSLEV
ncbi:hypothetical protein Csa_020550 [Cucumis sativus]|nr:hypothetical protein Csa_020550 [Cucumis sativus]